MDVSPIQSPMSSIKELSNSGNSAQLLSAAVSPPLLVEIEPNTPAAEALAANSSIKVSKLHKAARSTRLQSTLRVLKSAARTASGQPGHAGDRRGAPDFVAPNQSKGSCVTAAVPTILEEGEEEATIDPLEEEAVPAKEGSDSPDEDESTSTPVPLDRSIEIDDEFFRDLRPGPRHTSPNVHAALPAAIAAACRAGEELDRQRIQLTPTEKKNRLTLFKSKEVPLPLPSQVDQPPPPPPRMIRRRSSDSNVVLSDSTKNIVGSLRRLSLEEMQIHKFLPEEITCEDVTEQQQILHDTEGQDLDDLSDEENEQTSISKKVTIEDSGSPTEITIPPPPPDAEDTENYDSPHVKRKSRRLKLSTLKNPIDETFHFHGPKSVRNWVKRRRREFEHDGHTRSYVKGKVIDRQHELFIMSIAIMLGMRTSIGRTNMQMAETSHNERRWLDNDDLMAVEKYVFPPRGSEITPPHQLNHTFKFKDYSPHAFAYLRRMFGVNEYEFLLSVCGNANYIEFQSNAKSGQFFFYSKDGKYMIKTMTNAESKFLRRITPHYFRHCCLNPNTLVTKFLGMYRVKLYHLRRNVKFVVMKSVYDTDKHLHQVFDVKGSSTGRDARPGEAVKKDNDVRRSLPEGAFFLEFSLRERLRMQVERDCQWLKAMKIMDYSMLIGVHNIAHRSHKRTSVSTPGKSKPKSASSDDGLSKSQFSSTNAVIEDGDEYSHASFDASYMTLDRYLDEDDDDSYLEGSTRQRNKSRLAYEIAAPVDDACTSVRVIKSADSTNIQSKRESEEHVEKAIEDMYWPFHRYYDLQGRRRLMPIKEELIPVENKCHNFSEDTEPKPMSQKSYLKLLWSSSAPSSFGDSPNYEIPTFEKPLSERKDGGFMMDLTDIETPIKLSIPGAPHMAEYCDGKIFYMGIIDILQQFNIRKRIEARWRRMGGSGWEAASCVHPTIYADRFLRFFDEYTARMGDDNR